MGGSGRRLSTFDVYLHYLIYDAFRRLYVGDHDRNLGEGNVRDATQIYLPGGEILSAMGREINDLEFQNCVAASFNVLIREDLVADRNYAMGEAERMGTSLGIDAPGAGIVVPPSIPGVELYLWAHGSSSDGTNAFLRSEEDFVTVEGLGTVPGARKLHDMRAERQERIAAEGVTEATFRRFP